MCAAELQSIAQLTFLQLYLYPQIFLKKCLVKLSYYTIRIDLVFQLYALTLVWKSPCGPLIQWTMEVLVIKVTLLEAYKGWRGRT